MEPEPDPGGLAIDWMHLIGQRAQNPQPIGVSCGDEERFEMGLGHGGRAGPRRVSILADALEPEIAPSAEVPSASGNLETL